MKKLRIAAMVVVMAISALAMAKASQISSLNEQTWYFNGNPGEENDASKYQSSPVSGVECGGNGIICSITAQANGDQPLLDSNDPVSPSNPDYQPVTQRQ